MYMTDCKTGRGNPKLTEKILKFGEPNVEILETFDESVKLISDLEMSEIELRYIKTQKPNLNRQYF